MSTLAKNLKKLRGNNSKSVAGKMVGVSSRVWEAWESGGDVPDFAQITTICRMANTTPNWLFGIRDDIPSETVVACNAAIAAQRQSVVARGIGDVKYLCVFLILLAWLANIKLMNIELDAMNLKFEAAKITRKLDGIERKIKDPSRYVLKVRDDEIQVSEKYPTKEPDLPFDLDRPYVGFPYEAIPMVGILLMIVAGIARRFR